MFFSRSFPRHVKFCETPISRSFHGLLASRLDCPHCKEASTAWEPFVVLALPLKPEEDGASRVLAFIRCKGLPRAPVSR